MIRKITTSWYYTHTAALHTLCVTPARSTDVNWHTWLANVSPHWVIKQQHILPLVTLNTFAQSHAQIRLNKHTIYRAKVFQYCDSITPVNHKLRMLFCYLQYGRMFQWSHYINQQLWPQLLWQMVQPPKIRTKTRSGSPRVNMTIVLIHYIRMDKHDTENYKCLRGWPKCPRAPAFAYGKNRRFWCDAFLLRPSVVARGFGCDWMYQGFY